VILKTKSRPAVLFVFYTNWKCCWINNLIKGGDLNNAIVVVDKPVGEAEMKRLKKIFEQRAY
jgi:UDP-3-O-[3-hydroxymyristoyl] N-acetylglucosamine deacetylase/3-hydroxyacyl-[acyl-carrier-protein] dehydratase